MNLGVILKNLAVEGVQVGAPIDKDGPVRKEAPDQVAAPVVGVEHLARQLLMAQSFSGLEGQALTPYLWILKAHQVRTHLDPGCQQDQHQEQGIEQGLNTAYARRGQTVGQRRQPRQTWVLDRQIVEGGDGMSGQDGRGDQGKQGDVAHRQQAHVAKQAYQYQVGPVSAAAREAHDR